MIMAEREKHWMENTPIKLVAWKIMNTYHFTYQRKNLQVYICTAIQRQVCDTVTANQFSKWIYTTLGSVCLSTEDTKTHTTVSRCTKTLVILT